MAPVQRCAVLGRIGAVAALGLLVLSACARQPDPVPPASTGSVVEDDRPGILAPNEALCREPGAPLSCAGTGEGGVPAESGRGWR